jgi:hypothetical protein
MYGKVVGLIGTVAMAGLLIAGCGNATSPAKSTSHITAPQSKASPTATPKTTTTSCSLLPSASKVSVAEGASNSYTFSIPTQPATTPPSEWAGMTKTSHPVLPASDWESYIPHVTVTNDTNGAVSNCTVQTWADGLLKMWALDDWASLEDAPQLEQATAAAGGTAAEFYGGPQSVAALMAGETQSATGTIYPSQLVLVALTKADQVNQLTTSSYAFVAVESSSDVQKVVTVADGKTTSSTSSATSNDGGQVVAFDYQPSYAPGGADNPWPFGAVSLPTSDQQCSADTTTEALCSIAGAP